MAYLELKLATLRDVLFKIGLYEKLISDKGYKELDTRKYKNSFKSLRNSIEFEITQTQELLKTEGVEHPREDFSCGEVWNCLSNETEIAPLINELNIISMEIFNKSERLMIGVIRKFDFPPEWIFPTSTACPTVDIANVQAFLESKCKYSSVDDLFIDTLMSNERINQTLNFWKQEPKISNRFLLIEEAIQAHIDKKFYLSVSALIPQVEGILRDALESMNRKADFDSMRKEDMRRATSALKDLWKLQPEATSLLDSLPDAVSDLYDEFIPAQSMQGKLYRHGVCHGLQTDFGSEKNSLRLILLLDRIIFFYTMS